MMIDEFRKYGQNSDRQKEKKWSKLDMKAWTGNIHKISICVVDPTFATIKPTTLATAA